MLERVMTRVFKTKKAYVASFAFFALLAAIAWTRYAHPDTGTFQEFSNTELFIYLFVPFTSVISKFRKTQNVLEKGLIVLLALELVWMHIGRLRFHDVPWTSASLYWITCFVLLTVVTLASAVRTLQVFRETAVLDTNPPAPATV
jgi:hypothetical protein